MKVLLVNKETEQEVKGYTIFEEGKAEIYKSGMHFCKNPLDVLDYYPLIDNNGDLTEFAKVEALDECKTNDDEKFCSKKLKIGTKLSLKDFIKESFCVAYNNIKNDVISGKNGGDYATLVGGDNAKLVGGDNAKLVGGDYAKLAGGDYAKLAGGYYATLVGDDYAKLAGGDNATLAGGCNAKLAGGDYATLAGGCNAKLVGGYYAKLVGGYNAKLAGGCNAKLAGGDYATLVGGDDAKLVGGDYATLAGGCNAKLAGGDYATLVGGDDAKLVGGDNAVLVGGNGSFAKGKKGTVIVLFEKDKEGNIKDFKAEQIDGKKIKENVAYKLVDGEFVEVDKSNA